MRRIYIGLLVTLSLLVMTGVVNRAAAQPPALAAPTIAVVKITPHQVWIKVTAGTGGAPHGVYLEWMYQSDFTAYAGWAPYGDPLLYYCSFRPGFNAPSRHTAGATSYNLLANESTLVGLGDLWDEDWSENNYGQQDLRSAEAIVIRAHSLGDGINDSDSPNCGDHGDSPDSEHNSCTHTYTYWRANQSLWPPAVSSLMLGSVTYTKAQLVSILNRSAARPKPANGLISLCHELIATKLNIQAGADPSLVNGFVLAADAMIGGLICPPVGSGFLTPSSVESLADNLDDWNEGELGPVVCNASTSTISSTWGRLKTLYR